MLVILPPFVKSMNSEANKLKLVQEQNAHRSNTKEGQEVIKGVFDSVKIALIGYFMIFIVLLVWWISVFKRTSERKCDNGIAIMIINFLFGPVFGEIFLFGLCRK